MSPRLSCFSLLLVLSLAAVVYAAKPSPSPSPILPTWNQGSLPCTTQCTDVPIASQTLAGGSTVYLGYTFTPSTGGAFCAIDPASNRACDPTNPLQVRVHGYASLTLSCSPAVITVTVPIYNDYSIPAGTTGYWPTNTKTPQPTASSTYQASYVLPAVSANCHNPVGWTVTSASFNEIWNGGNFVDPLTFGFHWSTSNTANAPFFFASSGVSQNSGLCQIPPNPLTSGQPALSDPRCGAACACSSYEVTSVVDNPSLGTGGKDITLKACIFNGPSCKGLSWFGFCVPTGVYISGAGSAGGPGKMCPGGLSELQFTSTSSQGKNGVCSTIQLKTTGWTDQTVIQFETHDGNQASAGGTGLGAQDPEFYPATFTGCPLFNPPPTTPPATTPTSPPPSTSSSAPPTSSSAPPTSSSAPPTSSSAPPTGSSSSPPPPTDSTSSAPPTGSSSSPPPPTGSTSSSPPTSPPPPPVCTEIIYGPPPECTECRDFAPFGDVVCCTDNGNGKFSWSVVKETECAGANQAKHSDKTKSGYSFKGCDCTLDVKECTTPCEAAKVGGSACLCDRTTGTCKSDPICNLPPPDTTPGAPTCVACPKVNGVECGSNGACNCGQCVCADTYSGADCSVTVVVAVPCAQFADCTSCASSTLNCDWCPYTAKGVCQASGTCGVAPVSSADLCQAAPISFQDTPCPNNCSGNGVCQADSYNITKCTCKNRFHGIDCGSSGGLNTAAKAAAISAGVIAAIVICGVIVIVIVSFGAKKAVDWVQLSQEANAKSNVNPMYTDSGAAGNSGLYKEPSSPRS